MGYEVKVIADSLSPDGVRLTSLEVTFPRFVLAEFNTHRMFSRNSASSRAIPVEKRIRAVETNPFVPAAFGKNKPGMQAAEDLDSLATERAREEWLTASREAVYRARRLAELGVHKQLANRVLEPYLWHTVICTATEWDNFFALRCHPDAQPEIRTAAELMRAVMGAHKPRQLKANEWHLPYIREEDVEQVRETEKYNPNLVLARISAGRCARVSYLTHDGRRDLNEDIALADRLQKSGHMSPFEHPAIAMRKHRDGAEITWSGNFRGFVQYRKMLVGEAVFQGAAE